MFDLDAVTTPITIANIELITNEAIDINIVFPNASIIIPNAGHYTELSIQNLQ